MDVILTGAEGIDHVYGVEDFPKLGYPLPTVTDQAPDLVLAAVPDYMFSNESDGEFVTQVATGGTHGYINTDPKMQAIFIAWGAGVPAGVRINSISNLDVAPTIAALFGLQMKQAKGHAIRGIVKIRDWPLGRNDLRQILLKAPGELVERQVPAPHPSSGEALLRIWRVGVCGSDFHALAGRHPAYTYPRVRGGRSRTERSGHQRLATAAPSILTSTAACVLHASLAEPTAASGSVFWEYTWTGACSRCCQ